VVFSRMLLKILQMMLKIPLNLAVFCQNSLVFAIVCHFDTFSKVVTGTPRHPPK